MQKLILITDDDEPLKKKQELRNSCKIKILNQMSLGDKFTVTSLLYTQLSLDHLRLLSKERYKSKQRLLRYPYIKKYSIQNKPNIIRR